MAYCYMVRRVWPCAVGSSQTLCGSALLIHTYSIIEQKGVKNSRQRLDAVGKHFLEHEGLFLVGDVFCGNDASLNGSLTGDAIKHGHKPAGGSAEQARKQFYLHHKLPSLDGQ